MRTITLVIPGQPISKQSVRASVNRRFQDGQSWCPFCNHQTKHRAGDVVVFKNKISGKVDVILQMYQDSKYARLDKAIRLLVQQQLPKGFIMFEKEVHIDSLDYIFPLLSSFTKKQVQFIKDGGIIYKTVKPDEDNLAKPLNDSFTGLLYRDDALIVTKNKIRKIYGIEPKTIITLTGE